MIRLMITLFALFICLTTNSQNEINLETKTSKKVLIPIPSYGFDPTETAIPWKLMNEKNIKVVFATPNGQKAKADSIMLNGKNLGFWKFLLRARKDAVAAYSELEKSDAFCNPVKYSELKESDFDAILLPGGHDKGVKEYLESKILQELVVDFFISEKPVGAICHGVVLVSRSKHPETKTSVIYDYKTTALLKKLEMSAYKMTKKRLNKYYLTYPGLTVEDEVKSVLRNEENFISGKKPKFRDSPNKLKRGFVVKDRNYISARWPGDVYSFSLVFIETLLHQDGSVSSLE